MLQLEKNNLFSLFYEKIDNSPFFYYKNNLISYDIAYEKINLYTQFLNEKNINKNDRILLALPNTPDFIYLFLSIARLGAISVLVNPDYKVFELDNIITDCDPALIITDKSFLKNYHYKNKCIAQEEILLTLEDINTPASPFYTGFKYLELEKNDVATIIYTSAIEGKPLGAMLSHYSIYKTIEMMNQFSAPTDTFLSILPLYHSFGLITTFLLPMCYRQIFHLIDSFDPHIIINTIIENKISSIIGVPLLFKVLNMFHKKDVNFSFLRLCISGGEAIDKEIQHDFEKKYGAELREGYGITEASPIVTWNQITAKNVIGSVGPAMPWNEIKIADEDEHKVGEVLARGVNIFQGYYNKPEETDKSLIDGWFHTGDLGYIDENGYLYLTGIKKNMLLNNGLNVYPKEIEKLLLNHKDIETADCLVATQHSRQTLKAVIQTSNKSLNKDNLKKWCKQYITKYKIPRSFIINYN